MNFEALENYKNELLATYPEAKIKFAQDNKEMVAEINGKLAVAIIEKSQPHFHLKTREVYRVLRGTLLLAIGGKGHVLKKGEEITIEPSNVHYAKSRGEPAWVEVISTPDWTLEDFFVL